MQREEHINKQVEEAKLLHKAAESLLLDIENGTAPWFGVYRNFTLLDGKPCCAMGHIYARAGFKEENVPTWALHGFYAAKVNTANDLADKPGLIKAIQNLITAYKNKIAYYE